MKEELLREYARLIASTGANVEKGEEVWITASLDQPEFVKMVVEECYKLKAKSVTVRWTYDEIAVLNYKYQTLGELGKVSPIELARFKYMAKKLPTTIFLDSDDPDAFKSVSQVKIAKASAKRYPKIKKYRQAAESKYKWCIAGVPGKKWAHKVFPELSLEEAEEKLWEAILKTSRVEEGKAVANWQAHNEFLDNQKRKLHDLRLVKLIYKANNGTDFSVELNPDIHWGAGKEETPSGRVFNPNIPSEEVFTTPIAGKCEGLLVASKPLSYNGVLIEDFSVRFENGKVKEVKAKRNQKALEEMVKMDEGASMLGEVALVPYSSPIRESGVLFFNTLYDENAACHVALGMGFKELYDPLMDVEEAKKVGINDSMIHVDFMIGTKDLDIIGVTEKGDTVQVFKDGEWAI